MQRVFFLNRYYFPDHSATSQILTDLTVALAALKHEVHVITSQQLYDDPGAKLPAKEIAGGVTIHRISTTRFGRSHLLGRAIDYISFYVAIRRTLAAITSADDIVIAMTDPPLLSVAVLSTVKRSAAILINWLQDLYPEVAVASGMLWLKGPIGGLLIYVRDRSIKAARLNVVVGKRMTEHLLDRGIPRQSIRPIPNFADNGISPVAAAENPLRRQWKLSEKFVVGYSGNLGRVHEFETILGAARRLSKDPRIVFLCIGGGRLFEMLAQETREQGLQQQFIFYPYQPREILKYSLSVPDVHWVSLRPQFEGLVVPSKFYAAAAAGRPIVAITSKTSEIATLVQHHDCGVIVEPGDIDALVEALTLLMNDPSLRATMGARARAMVDIQFTKMHAVRSWARLIDELQSQQKIRGSERKLNKF